MFWSGITAILRLLPDIFIFAWAIAVLFVISWLLNIRNINLGRVLAAGAWGLFGLFWLALVPYFAFEHQSYVQSIFALAGVFACVYAGYLLYNGRESLFTLTWALGIMLFVYLPFETIPAFSVAGVTVPAPRQVLIEIVSTHTGMLIDLLGYAPERVISNEGYNAAYEWHLDDATPSGLILCWRALDLGVWPSSADLSALSEHRFSGSSVHLRWQFH